MGTGSAFQVTKIQANVETRRGNKEETLQSMCKAPLPPTSPPTLATAFANIAQHWLDKYKKSNKKTQKDILDLSHSYPAIPVAPVPKAPKKLPKATKKHPKSIQKAPEKHPKTLPDPTPEKVTKKTPLFCVLCCPWSPKWIPKSTQKSQKDYSKLCLCFWYGFCWCFKDCWYRNRPRNLATKL